nr:unnamed protein product [Digitaria exilis]
MSRGPRLEPLPRGAGACLIGFRPCAARGGCCFSRIGVGLAAATTSSGPRLRPRVRRWWSREESRRISASMWPISASTSAVASGSGRVFSLSPSPTLPAADAAAVWVRHAEAESKAALFHTCTSGMSGSSSIAAAAGDTLRALGCYTRNKINEGENQ